MRCVEIYRYSFLSFLHIHKYCVNCEKKYVWGGKCVYCPECGACVCVGGGAIRS